jgi:hypothetical protein
MPRRKCTTLVALCAFAATASPTLAATPTYSLETSQPAYTAPTNTTLSVDVYLRETTPPGDPSPLAAAGGLFSGAFRVSLTSPPTTDTTLLSLSPGPGFDGAFVPTLSPTSARLYEDRATAIPPGVLPTPDHLIQLGTLTLHTGPAPATLLFSLSDFDPSSTDLLTIDGTPLDPSLTPGSFSLTITPEPTSLALLTLPLLALTRRRHRQSFSPFSHSSFRH